MKELITTQLIEEYQKIVFNLKSELESNKLTAEQQTVVMKKIGWFRYFITELQSKQSEERQNIKTAYEALKEDWDGALFNDSEDYFNQTFKQEQKVIDANGGEEGK